MRKPGYYYYENKRALKGIAFLVIIILCICLSKLDLPMEGDFLELYCAYRLCVLLLLLASAGSLFIWRRIKRIFNEPRPSWYKSREDFIDALDRYAERQRYKHGWVYFRSNELWPDN